jgi:RHS repeat-associated protein
MTDIGFTGHRMDAGDGLIYMKARYYDPGMGRFITPDTIVQAPFDPQTLNRYTYCRNNPINLIDPSGHSTEYGYYDEGILYLDMSWYAQQEKLQQFQYQLDDNWVQAYQMGQREMQKAWESWASMPKAQYGSMTNYQSFASNYSSGQTMYSNTGYSGGMGTKYTSGNSSIAELVSPAVDFADGAMADAALSSTNSLLRRSPAVARIVKSMFGVSKYSSYPITKSAAQSISALSTALALGSGALDIYGVMSRGGMSWDQRGTAISRITAKTAGGWVGAVGGASIGAFLGSSVFPPVGTVVGAGLGAIVGGYEFSGGIDYFIDYINK